MNFLVLLLLQFYFQNGQPPPVELKEQCLYRINHFFYGRSEGLQITGETFFSPCDTLRSGLLIVFWSYRVQACNSGNMQAAIILLNISVPEN